VIPGFVLYEYQILLSKVPCLSETSVFDGRVNCHVREDSEYTIAFLLFRTPGTACAAVDSPVGTEHGL
jgi:hypothetical protein